MASDEDQMAAGEYQRGGGMRGESPQSFSKCELDITNTLLPPIAFKIFAIVLPTKWMMCSVFASDDDAVMLMICQSYYWAPWEFFFIRAGPENFIPNN